MTRGPAQRAAEAVVRAIATHPWISVQLLLVALVSGWFAWGRAVEWHLERMPVDNGLGVWFLDDDPAMVAYRGFQRDFGNDEAILIALPAAGETVFEPTTLDLIAEVSRRLRSVPRVRGVTSLATVLHTGSDAEGALVVEKMYRAPVATPAAAAAVRARVLGDPLYRRDLVSDDERTTLLTVQLERVEDIDAERGAILAGVRAEVEGALREAGRDPAEWARGGLGVMNEELNALSQADLRVFFSLTCLVIVLCLWLSLRRVVPVLLAMTAVYLATVTLVGVYLACGLKLNMVTMVLPTLVLVIGLTDSVYFITAWYQERAGLEAAGLDRREAIVRCLGFCFLPGLFNSVTASVGFLAFATARMQVIRQLGLFAGLGILLAFAASVVVCTVGFQLFDVRPPRGGAEPPWPRAEAALGWLARWVARRRRAILCGSGAVILAGAGGVLLLQVDTYTIRYFRPDHPVRRDNDWIEARFGPYLPLEVVVDTGAKDGLVDPAVLGGMDRLQEDFLAAEAGRVRSAVSLTGVVKRLNESLGPGGYALPATREGVAQELLFYDPLRNDDPLQLTDFPAYRQGRITFRTSNESAGAARGALERLERLGQDNLPAGARLVPSGYVPLYVRLVDYLVWGQVTSLLTTGLVISLLIALLFRSARYALLSLPANLIPVIACLGFMGYAGIHLDVATVLIASIALGVAVDDTIHFLFKFRAVAEECGDDAVALERTLRTTGVAIASTSLVIALGFSVLCFAQLRSVAHFGALTAVTMIAALVAELLVTPAVILTFAPRRRDTAQPPPEPEVLVEA